MEACAEDRIVPSGPENPQAYIDGLPTSLKGRSTEDPFRTLVEELVLQHKREVQALQAQLDAFLAEQVKPNNSMQQSQESGSADAVAVNISQQQASPTGDRSAKKRMKKSEMREVQADEVLHLLDGERSQQLFMSVDDGKDDFLADFPTEEDPVISAKSSTRFEKLQESLQSTTFEGVITVLLLVNVLWMALELQIHGSRTAYGIGLYKEPLMAPETFRVMEQLFTYGDIIFTAVFAIDVIVRVAFLGFSFWKQCMNYIDVAVVITSVFEVFLYSGVPVNPMLFRLLRIGKLARTFRMVTMSNVLQSLQLLIKCLSASVDMLFWTFCLLTFLQCIAGLVVGTLCRDFVADETIALQLRQDVFRYYGTFSRTMLTMFEILFANWAPPARVLLENMSEWFSVFFLLYRCVLGFAVLNVVSAVFVQQTMKTATNDEELAFKQKERDTALYTRKVKKVFATMDKSGDGALNMEEFAKLVKSPKLKFWMSQLELEYHDLMSLFEFLDNGDGQITLTEFIEGAARLRGSAKALDVWRLETKVEVLFEEVVGMLRKVKNDVSDNGSECGSHIGDVFASSRYAHIKMTTGR